MKISWKKELKVKIQSFGSALSSMIMPIIGIFIAWGLLTSFVHPKGWTPNQELASMIDIGIIYVIPLLIAFLGGKRVYDLRGAAIASLVAIAVIAAGQSYLFKEITESSGSMLLGAMIFGPLAALILKHTEKFWINKIKSGYEMLVNNFYLGILGFVLLFPIFYICVYVIGYLNVGLSEMVKAMKNYKLYPLLAIIIEPAKIFFLNNAINHGVFTPLGTAEVSETGKSILFLLESNPGPGLGVLIAWIIFGGRKNKEIKAQAASTIPIHFLGGIHEVYFPFVLLKPLLILSVIAGGIVGNLTFQLFDVGAVAPVSPGSVISQFIQVNKNWKDILGLTLGIVFSASFSLLCAWLTIYLTEKYSKKKMILTSDLKIAQEKSKNMKVNKENKIFDKKINVIFACDAGMGSSVMGSGIFKNLLKSKEINNIEVAHKAINNLQGDEKIIITIHSLFDRVKAKNPNAKIYDLDQFLNKKRYEQIIEEIINETN
ncbi:PTS mannitol transporter subunit IICB [Mesomycoplasma lagogenitalium]|uniref:PTS system mannitol-specific EIICB component n=1 Tax=Mesomycoplasma lagogenitalium TaxID=171286 RepID=A0ABY8LWX9_9BACT|nr:PTS mannitol transporter subunit IICB [Mesomycoplasma lagogenitalium]WGI36627.1 PTS mannitol transporter subunit IICB [Mesomycoplasma lagogenitalium]